MAILRLLYRKKNILLLFFTATTFWIIYLIVSVPAATDRLDQSRGSGPLYKNSVDEIDVHDAAPRLPPRTIIDPNKNVIEQPPRLEDRGQQLPAENEVIPPPPDIKQGPQQEVHNDQEKVKNVQGAPDNQIQQADKPVENVAKRPDIVTSTVQKDRKTTLPVKKDAVPDVQAILHSVQKLEKKIQKVVDLQQKTQNGSVVLNSNNTKQVNQSKDSLKDKVIQIGENIKNKTIEVGEKMKNKTLEKLSEMGVIRKKQYIKFIRVPVKWVLNLSLEDIGNIMKDTEFLKKQQSLQEMRYQPLQVTGEVKLNRTHFNYTLAKDYGVGYCRCQDLSCNCCVRVINPRMRLNTTACSSFSFVSKSQELDFKFSLDKKSLFNSTVSAEYPPRICLESMSKVADLCISYINITSQVNIQEEHKLHLSGCTEFSLSLYNRTVSTFPVDCFRIPGDEKIQHKKEVPSDLGNWMP